MESHWTGRRDERAGVGERGRERERESS